MGRGPVVLAAVVLAGCATLTPQQYKERGLGELRAGSYADALESFESAGKGAPGDAEALLLQGAALNRLGRTAEALPRLERARAAGLDGPLLALERGWSLLGAGRWQEAAAELERSERARPGVGATAEGLGRAYLGLGNLERAEGWLLATIERDTALEPDALFLLALLERQRKNPEAGRRYLDRIRDEFPSWRWPDPPK